MGESWYLAADFQLFLFGPWFMMLIWSFEKIQLMLSVGFMAVLLATSCAIPGKFRLRFEFQFSQNSVISKKLKKSYFIYLKFHFNYHDVILFETFKEENILKTPKDHHKPRSEQKKLKIYR